jgi:hypothetical protein
VQWGNGTAFGGQVLRLATNSLTGALPAGWQALAFTALSIDLSNNSLAGPFPASWWNSSGLPNGTTQGNTSFNVW